MAGVWGDADRGGGLEVAILSRVERMTPEREKQLREGDWNGYRIAVGEVFAELDAVRQERDDTMVMQARLRVQLSVQETRNAALVEALTPSAETKRAYWGSDEHQIADWDGIKVVMRLIREHAALASLVPPPASIPAGGPPAQSSAIERNGSAATRRVPRAAKRDRSGKPTTEAQRALRAHESGESGLKAESDSVAIGSGSVSSVVGSNGACPEPGRGEAARV